MGKKWTLAILASLLLNGGLFFGFFTASYWLVKKLQVMQAGRNFPVYWLNLQTGEEPPHPIQKR